MGGGKGWCWGVGRRVGKGWRADAADCQRARARATDSFNIFEARMTLMGRLCSFLDPSVIPLRPLRPPRFNPVSPILRRFLPVLSAPSVVKRLACRFRPHSFDV